MMADRGTFLGRHYPTVRRRAGAHSLCYRERRAVALRFPAQGRRTSAVGASRAWWKPLWGRQNALANFRRRTRACNSSMIALA